jgi:hypothetical protein
MTQATSEVTTQVEIKWFHELDEDTKYRAYFDLEYLAKDLVESFLGDPCRLGQCLNALSEYLEVEYTNPDGLDDACKAFMRETSLLPWLVNQLELVSHGDPLEWYFLIPIGHKHVDFKLPTNQVVFTQRLFKGLYKKLLKVWWQRNSKQMMRVTDEGYKTPRQFSVDVGMSLRKVNCLVKKHWGFLEDDCGSFKLAFPGADTVVLLSPSAQDFLKTYTPSGALNWFKDHADRSDGVKAMGDDPLFN